jgi:hypothetical protein
LRFAPFRSRAGSLRSGVGGRAAPLQRLAAFGFGMPTHASASPCFGVAVVGLEAPTGIHAPSKTFASRWSGHPQPGFRSGISLRVLLRRSLPPQTLAPLAPPAHASPAAYASGGGIARSALRESCWKNRTVLARASSAPRFHVVFVPHTTFQPPVPPPGASPQVEPFRLPTAIPLDPPRPPAAKSIHRFCVRKSRSCNGLAKQGHADSAPMLGRGWPGRSRLRQASFASHQSRRYGVQSHSTLPATTRIHLTPLSLRPCRMLSV